MNDQDDTNPLMNMAIQLVSDLDKAGKQEEQALIRYERRGSEHRDKVHEFNDLKQIIDSINE